MKKIYPAVFVMLVLAMITSYAMNDGLSFPYAIFRENTGNEPLPVINLVVIDTSWKYPILWSLENNMTRMPKGVNLIVGDVQKANNFMISGNAEMGYMSTTAYAIANDKKNTTLKIVSAGTTQTAAGVFTYRGSNVSMENLDSVKKVLTSPASSTNAVVFKGVLKEKLNITFDTDDVVFISKPFPVLPTLLEKKEADIASIGGGVYFNALDNPELELLYNYADGFNELHGNYAVVSVIVADESILDDPRTKEILSVLRESWQTGLQNADAVDRWASEIYGGNYTDEFMHNKDKVRQLEPLTRENRRAIQRIWEYTKESGVTDTVPDIDYAMSNID